jgi:hypothetical protein
MTLSLMTLNLMTLGLMTVVWLSAVYAECINGECSNGECSNAECNNAECSNAECHYVDCLYVECRGDIRMTKPTSKVSVMYLLIVLSSIQFNSIYSVIPNACTTIIFKCLQYSYTRESQ